MGRAYDHTALRRHATNNPSFFWSWIVHGRVDKDITYVFEKCMLLFLKMYLTFWKTYVTVFKTYVYCFKKFSPITEESATSTSDLWGMYVHTRYERVFWVNVFYFFEKVFGMYMLVWWHMLFVVLKKFLECYCWCGDTCCLWFVVLKKVLVVVFPLAKS